MCDEGTSSQVNYLIDEAQSCGKGANSIVSMVHHFLQNFAHGANNILLHADNCVGQNKNNTMIQYLAWRVITGLSTSCELSFMIPKFSPDRFFGMIKRKYRRTKIDSLTQLAEMVNSSTIERILLIFWAMILTNLSPTTTGLNFYRLTLTLFRKSLVIITSVFAILLLVVYLYENLPMTKKWS